MLLTRLFTKVPAVLVIGSTLNGGSNPIMSSGPFTGSIGPAATEALQEIVKSNEFPGHSSLLKTTVLTRLWLSQEGLSAPYGAITHIRAN